jgi:hypothetical protein
LRLTPLARAETSRLSGRGTSEQENVLWPGRGNWTDIPAIETGGRCTCKEPSIEAWIAAVDGLPANGGVKAILASHRMQASAIQP